MEKGKLIYFESGEGGGKEIHTTYFENYLKSRGIKVIRPREPGGTFLAEKAREMVLNPKLNWNELSEIYLFQIARAELYHEVVKPSLEKGISVIQDRSKISSLGYQGYGAKGEIDFIKYLNNKSTYGIKPNLVFIIDVDPLVGLEKEIIKDRMSKKGIEFHKRVREGYLEIAKQNPKNYIVVPYIKDGINQMQEIMKPHIDRLFNL